MVCDLLKVQEIWVQELQSKGIFEKKQE